MRLCSADDDADDADETRGDDDHDDYNGEIDGIWYGRREVGSYCTHTYIEKKHNTESHASLPKHAH